VYITTKIMFADSALLQKLLPVFVYFFVRPACSLFQSLFENIQIEFRGWVVAKLLL
jgi:hypothetical protein